MKRLYLSLVVSFGDWPQQQWNIAPNYHPELVIMLEIRWPESYISFLCEKNVLIDKHTS
jgi:hypothetical protein